MLELLLSSPTTFVLVAGVLLYSLVLHELAHAGVADLFGDHTARNLGRLTLDPLKHLDLVGTSMLLLLGFGWAKPVPVTVDNLRRKRLGLLLVALAGVATNLTIATAALTALRLLGVRATESGLLGNPGAAAGWLGATLAPAILFTARINILLAVFNLLPIPPLDGAKALEAVLPSRWGLGLATLGRYGFLLVALVLITLNRQVFSLITVITSWLTGVILG